MYICILIYVLIHFKDIYYLYNIKLWVCVHLCEYRGSQTLEYAIRSPGQDTDSCEQLLGCWELNSGLLCSSYPL